MWSAKKSRVRASTVRNRKRKTVSGQYEIKAGLIAHAPASFGGLHKPDAAEQQREADHAAAAQTASRNMQPMMQQAQKIMERCGEGEACIQREAMKMARGIDPNSKEMQETKGAIAAASAMPNMRYQLFRGTTQSGSFTVKEVAHEAYFDAGCSLATEERCAIDSTVNGSGKLTDPSGATEYASPAMAEIDYQTGSLVVSLALPGFGTAQKTVLSKTPDVKSGVTEVRRTLTRDGILNDLRQTVSCGECRTAGTLERNIKDELLGRPAKLTVKWHFTRS